jgi:cytochrome c553
MTDSARSAMRLRDWSLGLTLGAAMHLPFSLPASADPRRISVENCAACHGADGVAPDTEVPYLAGQNEKYLFNQLMAFKTGQRRHKEMRFMARELTIEDMAALAAYYASLQPR